MIYKNILIILLLMLIILVTNLESFQSDINIKGQPKLFCVNTNI